VRLPGRQRAALPCSDAAFAECGIEAAPERRFTLSSTTALQLAGLLALACTTLLVSPALGYGKEAYSMGKTATFGLAAALGAATLARLPRARLSAADAWFGVFLVHGMVSMLVNQVPLSVGSATLLPELSAILVAASISAGTADDPRRRALVLDVLTTVATLMAAVALAEAFGLALPWSGIRRPCSTLGNRNFVGAEAAIGAALACGRLLQRPSWLRGASLLILVTTVGVTRCRSAWLGLLAAALAVGVAYLFMRRFPKARGGKRGLLQAAAAVILAVAATAWVPWPGLHWTDATHPMTATLSRLTEYETGTGRERLADLGIAAALAARSPFFGVGPRGWDDASSSLAHQVAGRHATPQHFWTSPNSDLARVLGERGFVGLLLLLTASGALAQRAFQARRLRRRSENLTLLAACTVLVVDATFDAPLFRPSTLALAAVLLGLLRAPAARTLAFPRGPRLVVLATLVVLLLAGTGLRIAAAATVARDPLGVAQLRRAQQLFWRADVAENLTLQLALDGRCEEAEVSGREALAVSPHHWGVPHALARCWRSRGNRARSAVYALERDRIEPHLAELFQQHVDLASGYAAVRSRSQASGPSELAGESIRFR